MELIATCHCGAVRFVLARPPVDRGDCNCSLCRRLGALWGYYLEEEVQQRFDENATFTYIQGDKLLRVHSCRVCGCTTHWDGAKERTPKSRMAINTRLMDPKDLDGIPLRKIDGASW